MLCFFFCSHVFFLLPHLYGFIAQEVAVSLLKEVLECHCRLNDSQKLPLDFELLESQPEAGDGVKRHDFLRMKVALHHVLWSLKGFRKGHI